MGISKQFGTDKKLEEKGVVVDYGGTRVVVARAGGRNVEFQRVTEEVSAPYRRAIESKRRISPEVTTRMNREIVARAVVRGWQTKVGEDWIDGIDPVDVGEPAGSPVPATTENVIKVFERCPDFLIEIISVASDAANYSDQALEDDAKN